MKETISSGIGTEWVLKNDRARERGAISVDVALWLRCGRGGNWGSVDKVPKLVFDAVRVRDGVVSSDLVRSEGEACSEMGSGEVVKGGVEILPKAEAEEAATAAVAAASLNFAIASSLPCDVLNVNVKLSCPSKSKLRP
jgi:hypothetical protein